MSDFIKFCPKCYTLFRDADLYQQHIAQCGTIKEKEAAKKSAGGSSAANSKRQTAGEAAESRRQTAAEVKSQDTGENGTLPPTVSLLPETPESPAAEEQIETVIPELPVVEPPAAEQPPKTKSPKFKT